MKCVRCVRITLFWNNCDEQRVISDKLKFRFPKVVIVMIDI